MFKINHKLSIFSCLFVWGFTSHSRIFNSYGDVTNDLRYQHLVNARMKDQIPTFKSRMKTWSIYYVINMFLSKVVLVILTSLFTEICTNSKYVRRCTLLTLELKNFSEILYFYFKLIHVKQSLTDLFNWLALLLSFSLFSYWDFQIVRFILFTEYN